MRPRLIAVDDRPQASDDAPRSAEASMRPRLIAVDDIASAEIPDNGTVGFNEATAYCRG